jgi:hypothetical protein
MSDCHAFLESVYLEDFGAFLVDHKRSGVRVFDRANIADRLDPGGAVAWKARVADTGRPEVRWSLKRRLPETDREGISAPRRPPSRWLTPQRGIRVEDVCGPRQVLDPDAAMTPSMRFEQLDDLSNALKR